MTQLAPRWGCGLWAGSPQLAASEWAQRSPSITKRSPSLLSLFSPCGTQYAHYRSERGRYRWSRVPPQASKKEEQRGGPPHWGRQTERQTDSPRRHRLAAGPSASNEYPGSHPLFSPFPSFFPSPRSSLFASHLVSSCLRLVRVTSRVVSQLNTPPGDLFRFSWSPIVNTTTATASLSPFHLSRFYSCHLRVSIVSARAVVYPL